ncbi:hypothetical protein, conserved [Trypanosoma brucei gambiense DAL972]|uniref:Uncharacterized protein n=2 Tax=Trypanosoma brucei TaxID=5691 RepID=D0A8H9_TRYB9|nr:hypothetical protein, conserved [Trypanosoma brucei gambiense DAL972]RHW68162.1 hypothetical protein DPX39_110069300 [Trypanosoma brucei equiperdum]CBH17980.1 hypothetical protein, conserved [Trypanosoma brucei gambiense DAL972]|eukprot:XP_011780244.1 hypothetical protein, conserved [Trypanosoma brucei gambiense DAL972]
MLNILSYSKLFSSCGRQVVTCPKDCNSYRHVSTGSDECLFTDGRASMGREFTLQPVEMEPVFKVHRPYSSSNCDNPTSEDDLPYECGASSDCNTRSSTLRERAVCDEPLAKGLQNTTASTPYRVSWYERGAVSPSKRFVYWAFRRLWDLPPDAREYYRRMLYQEVRAARYVNQTWDCFMMVVDGYRKGKWILKKYGIKIDEGLIPKPYNNFWEETTHEERVWAHRRSHQMKDLQALQREDDNLVFGAHIMDRREVTYGSVKNLQTGMQGGTPVHAHDLPAPFEADVKMSLHEEDISSALMSSIEDDKLWNPVLRSRVHNKLARDEAELYGFEDEDDGDDRS